MYVCGYGFDVTSATPLHPVGRSVSPQGTASLEELDPSCARQLARPPMTSHDMFAKRRAIHDPCSMRSLCKPCPADVPGPVEAVVQLAGDPLLPSEKNPNLMLRSEVRDEAAGVFLRNNAGNSWCSGFVRLKCLSHLAAGFAALVRNALATGLALG